MTKLNLRPALLLAMHIVDTGTVLYGRPATGCERQLAEALLAVRTHCEDWTEAWARKFEEE